MFNLHSRAIAQSCNKSRMPNKATGETKKRPDIAAKNKGPGPASYQLPTTLGSKLHDPTKSSGSSFSFGHRPETCMVENWRQPGPLYKPENVTKNGVQSAPKYTMQKAFKPIKDQGLPSPTAYSPEKNQAPSLKRMPSYSIGARLNSLKPDALQKPSPTAYTLPSTLGPTKVYGGRNSPVHSLKGKLQKGNAIEDLQHTPGVGAYVIPKVEIMTRKPASYTMPSKAVMPPEGTWLTTPGVGSYSPGTVKTHLRKSPAYSLGIRHSEYTMDNLQPNIDVKSTRNVQIMGSLGNQSARGQQ